MRTMSHVKGLAIRDTGTLKYPLVPRIACCSATEEQVKDCLVEVAADWVGKTYFLLGPNCMTFVQTAEKECCLEESPGPAW